MERSSPFGGIAPHSSGVIVVDSALESAMTDGNQPSPAGAMADDRHVHVSAGWDVFSQLQRTRQWQADGTHLLRAADFHVWSYCGLDHASFDRLLGVICTVHSEVGMADGRHEAAMMQPGLPAHVGLVPIWGALPPDGGRSIRAVGRKCGAELGFGHADGDNAERTCVGGLVAGRGGPLG
jgi:hypothetical protein